MVRPDYVPERGDLIWVDSGPTRGHEQAGRRPALVLSSESFNMRSGSAFICPLTSRTKGYPFEVPFRGEKVHGVALVDQSRSLDWKERRAEFIEFVPALFLKEVQRKLLEIILR